MSLGTTNITTTIARNAIGESSNTLSALCGSNKINQWSLHKPAYYGSGKDAWTTDSSTYSGYTTPLLASTNNYRLGDFRGYNHVAKKPSDFNGNQSYSYYRYETPVGFVNIYYGEMYYTSSGSGYSPQFHTLDEDGNGTLTSVQLEIDSVNHGSKNLLLQSRSTVYIPGITKTAGTYTLNAYYYTRLTDTGSWTKRNQIEGGSVSLVVTELPAKFTISNVSVLPTSAPAGVEDFTAYFRVNNTTTSTINYTFYWQFANKNGTKSISVPGSSYVDYSQQILLATVTTPSETWLLRMTNSSGQILDNSQKDVTIF